MRGLVAALGAVLVWGVTAVGTTAPAEAKQIDEFTIGQWAGFSYTNDQDGQFTDCEIWAWNRDNVQLGISVLKNWSLELWLNSKAWNLPAKTAYPISYWIDRNKQYSGRAETYSDKFVVIAVESDQAVFDELQNGSQVTFRAQNEDYIFDLSSSRAALNRLLDCVDQHGKEASTNPFGGGSANPQSPPDQNPQPDNNQQQSSTESQGDAASTKLKTLTQSADQVRQFLVDVTGAKPSMIAINPKENKAGYPYYSFSTPIGAGQFWQEYLGNDTLRDVVQDYFRGYKDECKGEFEQDVKDPVQGEHGQTLTGTATCSNSPYQDNGAEVLSYSLTASDDVIAVYVTFTGGNAAKAKTDSLGRLIARRSEENIK